MSVSEPQTVKLPAPRSPEMDAPEAPAQPTDTSLAVQALLLIQSLLKGCASSNQLAAGVAPAVRRRTCYTPRSDVPLTRLAVAPMAPTRLLRRTLHFSCPCCSRETVVVRRQAGQRLRCPHCNSAVEAPHPGRRRTAHNLQRDIVSLLRPETFSRATRPVPPWLVRTLVREPVLVLAFGSLIPISFMLLLGICDVLDRADGGVPTNVGQAAPPEVRRPETVGAADRAVALVERFLAAPTLQAKAACVRDPQRVGPMLAALAGRRPESVRPLTDAIVRAAGLSHYADPAFTVPVTPVVAEFKDGTNRTFYVEHGVGGDAIEWESSVGYSEPLVATSGTASSARATWRVEATPDDYFNRAFADADGLLCLRLSRPDAPDQTVWAYARKDSDVGRALSRVWNQTPGERVRRLTVTVDADPSVTATRQVRLSALHHTGWRSPDQPETLVAGNR